MIRIEHGPLDPAECTATLEADAPAIGAICTFTGLARDYGDYESVSGLFLEHYPGMTEDAIQAVIDEAGARWPIQAVEVRHRVGWIAPGERIVFVGVSSSHRREAFKACEFIMDYLKTRAPFWKKEITPEGETWVEQKHSDRDAAARWQSGGEHEGGGG